MDSIAPDLPHDDLHLKLAGLSAEDLRIYELAKAALVAGDDTDYDSIEHLMEDIEKRMPR